MLLDAFTALIQPHLETVIAAIVAAVMAIAVLLVGVIVFRKGIAQVLDLIQGHDSAPKVGYQYEEYDEHGKAHYKTWTKKDQYYHDKARRGD